MVLSLIQMLLCSINVFSVAGQKPSAAGRERTAYAGDFAMTSAMTSSGKAQALLATIVSWCLISLMLRRADLQLLAYTCTHLCLFNMFSNVLNTICMQRLLHCLGRLCQNRAHTVIQLLQAVIAKCHCTQTLQTVIAVPQHLTHRTMTGHK